MRTLVFSFIAAFVLAGGHRLPLQAVTRQSPAFDVVSIKPSPPGSTFSRTAYEANRIIASGVNLKQLIEWAYEVTDIQVSGGPAWIDNKFFDLEAKAEGSYNRQQLLSMLQPVLGDRFKLSLHRESKQMPVYVLRVNSTSSQLRDTKGGPANIQLQGGLAPDGKGATIRIVGQSVSMGYLTSYLTNSFGRLVLDRTDLKNAYDFNIEIALDQTEMNDKRAAITTSFWNALPKLGLKLDSERQLVDVLVIDHVEEPSPN